MDFHIRSELNRIKADDALVSKTEIYLRNELAHKHRFVKFSRHRLAFTKEIAKIACIILILIQSDVGRFSYYKMPASYISLDINPSIEFGVNIFDRVVSVEGYNSDGKNVLAGLNVAGTNVTAAMMTVISSAINNGFIEGDGSTVISVTSETDDTKTAQKLQSEAEAGVNEALEEKGRTALVVKDNVRLALRDEARKLSITPGKLNLIKKLQAVDPLAAVGRYRDAKVKEIVAATREYADSSNNSTKEITAINNLKKDVLNSQEGSAVTKKEQNSVKNIGESTLNSKDKSTAGSKADIDMKNKDGSAAGSEDKSAENSKGKCVSSSKDNNNKKSENEYTIENKGKSAANSQDRGAKKSEAKNNPSSKIGQAVNEQAVNSNREAARSNSTENAAGNMTKVGARTEKNNIRNEAKFSKK